MANVTRALWLVIAVLLALLVVSGVWLTFEYRPGPGQPMRRVHEVSSTLAVNLSLAAAVLGVVRRSQAPGLWAVAAFVLLAAWSFTGYLLPWDQLALWAVTVGTNLDGITPVWDRAVRFVLIGGTEIGPATYQRWALAHIAVLPAAAVVVAVFVVRRFRSHGAPDREAA